MTGSQRIEWRRCRPTRALSNLRWYAAVAVLGVACVWLLFGGEAGQLEGGGQNPLAAVPVVVTTMAVLGGAAMVVPIVVRPTVAADHYALLVRTGLGRRLALPWAQVAEVAVITVGHERHLLVRYAAGAGDTCARPGWVERAPLRRVLRPAAGGRWDRFDLAVPMRDFVGSVDSQLAALAAFAPDTVIFSAP